MTQNYAAPCNMKNVWIKVRKDRPRMAFKLLLQLQKHDPPLYHQAMALNERDKFRMKYDPVAVQERQECHNANKKNRNGNKKQRFDL